MTFHQAQLRGVVGMVPHDPPTPGRCPDCGHALGKWNRLETRMARRGNFGIVPLPLRCKKHRKNLTPPSPPAPLP